jgi:hypothetical protein
VGAFANHTRPNALLIEIPSALLAAVQFAVAAAGVLMEFKNAGLCAEYSCTCPPSVETCPSARANHGSITSLSALGSIESTEPCC